MSNDKTHDIVAYVVVILVVGLTATAWVWAGAEAHTSELEITIDDDGLITVWKTEAHTVAEVLAEAEIKLRLFDEIEPTLLTDIEEVCTIRIRRARPVAIHADGEILRVLTLKQRVGDILSENDIYIGEWDRVLPGLEDEVEGNITVLRVRHEEVQETQVVPYEKQTKNDPTLALGLSRFVQKGSEGEVLLTYRKTYEDDEMVSREIINEEVITEVVHELVAQGARDTIRVMGTEYRISRALISRRVTAYDPGPISTGKWADGLTKTGIPAGEGVVAVDPSVVPLGSRLYVAGYGFAVAADVGSAITGTALDVCFDTYEEAIQWGVKRNVKFYILE